MTQPIHPGHSEEGDQILVVNWFNRTYPNQASRLHHSPNGGYRDKRTGSRMRLMGTKAGFPDLVLYHPASGHTGLAIELKASRGRLRPNQAEWLLTLSDCGFHTAVCYGVQEALDVIRGYMGQGDAGGD